MNELQEMIKKVMRSHKMLDTGASEEIADVVMDVISTSIDREVNFANVAGQCLQGMLANPENEACTQTQLSQMAINQASDLMNTLDDMRAHSNSKPVLDS